ncbi:MAG: cupin domain-containing protein [Actinobacteria bacterium]|nr:cupin domain-containing protein [Actinomycetota bacterium]
MRRLNIASPTFEYDADDPDGFRSGMQRFGKLIGASRLGASVYELPPGQSICPYHYEYPEEEWLLVLEGRPTLRHPAGTDELEPWDVVCFPSGPEGAHAVRNGTDDTVRVLMFSTVSHPAVVVYPDSDKIGMWTGNEDDKLLALRKSAVDYWEGEAKQPE